MLQTHKNNRKTEKPGENLLLSPVGAPGSCNSCQSVMCLWAWQWLQILAV